MKKYLLSLMALAAIFACTRELPSSDEIASSGNADEQAAPDQGDEQKPQVQMTFNGVTDPDIEEAKTTLDDSDFGIVWSMGETISVLAGSNDSSASTFEVVELESGGRGAVFSGSSETADIYYAVSPAQSATVSGGVVTATLATSQTAVEGSFGPTANLAIAKAEGTNQLFFRNTGAIVGFTVGYDDVTRVKFEGLGASDVMSGTATFNLNGGVMPTLTGKTGVNYVEMTGDFVKNSTYYFVILPGTYANGVKISFYKGTSKRVTYSLNQSLTIGRNANVNIGKLDSKEWGENFDVLTIRGNGAAEAGQGVAYVGSSGYWDAGANTHTAVTDYPYNYEIFTSLNADQAFYFEGDTGLLYQLSGSTVVDLASAGSASYTVDTDGVYRIRMNMSNKTAEVKRITSVEFFQDGIGRVALTYQGNGVWKKEGLNIRRGGADYKNRYKFIISFDDSSSQYYGRHSRNGNNPVYGTTTADYFYVQPADNNTWEPGFKFPPECEIDKNRYVGTMTLSMNNDGGHYTHSVTQLVDSQNMPSFEAGDPLYIGGAGVDEDGQTLAVSYIPNGYYDTSVTNAGDIDYYSSQTYNYEIFTRLKGGKNIYFYGNDNVFFTINEDGDEIGQSTYPSAGAYSVPDDGIYRIRLNLPTGNIYISTVDHVYYYYGNDEISEELTYQNAGVWKKSGLRLKWSAFESYNPAVDEIRYHFRMILDGNKEQHFGRNKKTYSTPSVNGGTDSFDVQPTKVSRWDPGFNFPSGLKDDLFRDCYRADLLLYLNNTNDNGHYTHEFTNVDCDKPSTAVTGYSVSGATENDGTISLSKYLASSNDINSPITSYSDTKFELIRRFKSGNIYVRDNNGSYYTKRSNGKINANVTEAVYTTFTSETAGIYDFVFDPSGTSSSQTRIYGAVMFNHPWFWGNQARDYQNMTYNGNGHWKTATFNTWSTYSSGTGTCDDRFRFLMLTNRDYDSSSPSTTCKSGWLWGKVDGQNHAHTFRFDLGTTNDDWVRTWKPLNASGEESDSVLRDKVVTFWFHTDNRPFRWHIDVQDPQ